LKNQTHMQKGAFFALFAAALFGISPVLAKLWTQALNPPLLAGLLYLGSGLGLLLLISLQTISSGKNPLISLRTLTPRLRLKLFGAIIAGGILAPLSFVASFQLASAFEISLLLNLETVATAAIAVVFFNEHVSRRVLLSMGLLILAAAISTIPMDGEIPVVQWRGSAYVVLACLFWAIDNNLTREVEDVPASVLTCLRGLSAGTFNILISLVFFGIGPKASWPSYLPALGIGAICYGVSLVFFVEALRSIGSSRTATYFAVGPFWGMLFALLLLSEKTATHQYGAAVIGALAIWLLHREQHDHLHTHEPLTHSHAHTHENDDHHEHPHELDPGKPHVHAHSHKTISHAHRHSPDIHHRHPHKAVAKN